MTNLPVSSFKILIESCSISRKELTWLRQHHVNVPPTSSAHPGDIRILTDSMALIRSGNFILDLVSKKIKMD